MQINLRSKIETTTLLFAFLAFSFPLAVFAYFVGSLSLFAMFETASSFAFWFSIVFLVFLYPLRYVATLFKNYIKTFRGALVFVSYWSVHLFLYGLLLEGILAYGFKIHSLISQFYLSLTSVPVYPASATSVIAGFAFNPSVDLFIPPVYVLALSFYTISISFIIAVLVVTNVMKVGEIGKLCTKAMRSRTLVVLPALGVIGGAACCLSLPVLISLAAPTSAYISNSPLLYYLAYFLFPTATAFGLKYNMDSAFRIGSIMTKIVSREEKIAGGERQPSTLTSNKEAHNSSDFGKL